MSALAGIFKFDPRDHVNQQELMKLAHGIDHIGPDGGAEHLTRSLGMVYRAFHTTPESHLETQPFVRRGCVLTWDGRLDNREDIRRRLSRKYEEGPTDLDLAFAAYEEWGTSCFAELIGDWALALWDQTKQQLILARDYIGVRRLFYRLDKTGVVWCTTVEPLVLCSAQPLHLNLDYLAGYIYSRPPVETTPYEEILSIVPACFLTFRYGGKHTSEQYWSLNPHAKTRYSTDSEYEAHFRNVFRGSVQRRLRSDRTLLAELSGGLDSSSIVCMADEIRSRHPGAQIETLSYYDTDEPSGDERLYFTLVEEQRGRSGHHISTSELSRQAQEEALMPLPNDCFVASPGYFAQSFRWSSAIDEIQSHTEARVIVSGLGGDEVLGGVQYEAPELADHLLSGRLLSFSQSLFRWSVARKKTAFQLLGDVLQLLNTRCNPEALLIPTGAPLAWVHLKPLTVDATLKRFTDWRILSPPQLSMEWIRYNLAQRLTTTNPPLVGCAEKRYPYLDRDLFVFLASVPRTQILQAGRRRHLMRRAFRGLIPDGVLLRKTKWFGFRNTMAILRDHQSKISAIFEDKWLSDKMIVDAPLVQKQLEDIQHGLSGNGLQLYLAIGIEHWLRAQMRNGHIALTPSGTFAVFPKRFVKPSSRSLAVARGK